MNILVFIEIRDGHVKKSSLEAAKTAAGIAAQLGAGVSAVALGPAEGLPVLGGYGIPTVLHDPNPALAQYSTTAFAKAVQAAAVKTDANILFMSATSMGRDLAPRLAVKLDGAVAGDITHLDVEGGAVVATRPVYAGKALEVVEVAAPVQIFTLRPNVFSAGAPADATAAVETFDAALTDADFSVRATGTSISTEKLDVAEATMIVSGGRGLQGPEHWHLIEDLAGVLHAATGASRAVVDAGWRPHAEQVGQTGKTVSPTLYIACGISGAVQHLAGMSSSKTIVAINKDKDAPIFQAADYGIVGDVFEVLPALTDAIRKQHGA